MLRLRVKEIAQQQGLGQGKLARMADVDIKTLARIYKNPYAEVSSVTLEKLARALSVPIVDLIEEVDGAEN
jgi:transcriptional regulator with XRE-family HTH domain